jgi:hypothetical protein
MAYRKRHNNTNLQHQNEDASCRSSLAATADEASEPPSKFIKPDSPGEADEQSAALDFTLIRINCYGEAEMAEDDFFNEDCPIDKIPDELLVTVTNRHFK